jgi:hypothetical protein
MAELHGNGWLKSRDNKHGKHGMAPRGAWSLSKDDESEPRNPIELHGNAYIAFCKPWAPLWIDDETPDSE